MARPVFYQVAGSIGGERLRCGEGVCRGSIKNIISQDHSRHKEGGQPSRYDWMSPHTLGLSPASKIPPVGTLDCRHRISPGPISGNWSHLRGAGFVLNHRLMELKTFMTHAKEVWALFSLCLYHLFLARHLKTNKTTIWLRIKNGCGMLAWAHELNEKV